MPRSPRHVGRPDPPGRTRCGRPRLDQHDGQEDELRGHTPSLLLYSPRPARPAVSRGTGRHWRPRRAGGRDWRRPSPECRSWMAAQAMLGARGASTLPLVMGAPAHPSKPPPRTVLGSRVLAGGAACVAGVRGRIAGIWAWAAPGTLRGHAGGHSGRAAPLLGSSCSRGGRIDLALGIGYWAATE